jgi:hypothetical protein
MPGHYPEDIDYDIAKRRWSTFEKGRDSRFRSARLTAQYVTALVLSEGSSLDAIKRATRIFDDRLRLWSSRAEAYRNLASSLSRDNARMREHAGDLARKVYDFSVGHLENAPLHMSSAGFPKGPKEIGKTYDSVLQMLSWAVATARDSTLIAQHRDYLINRAASALQQRGVKAPNALVQRYQDAFEAQLSPESYCLARREPTDTETFRRCIACGVQQRFEEDTWVQLYGGGCKLQNLQTLPQDPNSQG